MARKLIGAAEGLTDDAPIREKLQPRERRRAKRQQLQLVGGILLLAVRKLRPIGLGHSLHS